MPADLVAACTLLNLYIRGVKYILICLYVCQILNVENLAVENCRLVALIIIHQVALSFVLSLILI